MKKIIFVLTFFILFFFFTNDVKAVAVSWDAGGAAGTWTDPLNWSNDLVPTSADDVTISTASGTLNVNIAASTTINSLTVGNVGGTGTTNLNFTYDAITNGALIINTGNLTVYSGGNITHSAGTTVVVGTVFIDVQTGSATINGTINVKGKGYQRNSGTGVAPACSTANCGGAAHGGTGGSSTNAGSTTVYGSATAPVTLGSGGRDIGNSAANNGGGAIKLTVAGTLAIGGTISAVGGDPYVGVGDFGDGGGSGGSIYLSGNTVTNTGTISANGAFGVPNFGAGGGGGRIAVFYTTAFTQGTVTAYGGSGVGYGGAGTIFVKKSGTNGDLTVDNNNVYSTNDRYLGYTPVESYTLDTITVKNYGRAAITAATNLTYTTLNWATKGIVMDNSLTGVFAPFTSGGDLTIPSTAYYIANVARSFGTITANGIITHSQNTTLETYKIDLTASGNITISGGINVDSNGFEGGMGSGTGVSNTNGAGGASYGGMGGNGVAAAGGAVYGSLTAPVNIGSGGGTSSSGTPGQGGGAVKLTAGGTITISANISANGGAASGGFNPGGGSGGSVYLTAADFAGTSTISVNGGNGISSGGGGAGGRISLNYTTTPFGGTTTAYGGFCNVNCGAYGGAGTIFVFKTGDPTGNLILDNNNHDGTVNDQYTGNTPLAATYSFNTITVRNYARLVISSGTNVTYNSLDWSTKGIIVDNGLGTFALVNASTLTIPATAYFFANTARTFTGLTVNGILTHSQNTTLETYKIDYTVNGDVTIGSGGSINVDSNGFNAATGTGAGGSNSGAGYGGIGGGTSGGIAYGVLAAPVNIGSGGGSSSTGVPGKGGGAVKLNVSGTLTVSGTISADGGNASGTFSPGGGSGGGIYLITGTFAGTTGVIRANGGNGISGGGGGAGGRIAIYYSTAKTYTGSMTVNGGAGGGTAAQSGTTLMKATGGTLVSTPFDTGSAATVISDLSWTESLPSGTDARFQIRTAPDSGGSPGTWTDWFGPTGAGTYYTDPTGVSENIYTTNSDGVNDQWFEYQVVLTAAVGDVDIPTISDVTISYTVNTSPTIASLAQYESDGTTPIATGATTQSTTVVFKMSMGDGDPTDTLTPYVEAKPVGTAFTNSGTAGSAVAYSGSPVTGTVTLTGLTDATSYHWQAKVCDAGGLCTSWTSYGGNAESATDFAILTNQTPNAPSSLAPPNFVDGSYTTDTTPTFTFNLSDPDVTDTVQYQIQIDDSSNFGSVLVDYTSALAAQGSFSFTVGQDAGGTYTTGSVGQTLTDASYYWRVKAIDNLALAGSYSTANSGGVAFILYTAHIDLDSPADNSYTNSQRPTFRWKETSTTGAAISSYDLSIDNPSVIGEPTGDFTISGIPPSRTTDYVTTKYIAHYDGFDDSDTTNNYISVYTRSSTDWGSSENDGKLREGKVSWTVKSTDTAGKYVSSSRNLYEDNLPPVLNITSVSNSNPRISGKLTDNLSTAIAAGPAKISIVITKSGNKPAVYQTITFDKIYYTCDDTLVTDNTNNRCGKYATFNFSPTSTAWNGAINLSLTGYDNAGNPSSTASYKVTNGNIVETTGKNTPPPKATATPFPTPAPTLSPEYIPPPIVTTVVDTVTTTIDTVVTVIMDVITTIVTDLPGVVEAAATAVTQEAVATVADVTAIATDISTGAVQVGVDVQSFVKEPTVENATTLAKDTTDVGVVTAGAGVAATTAIGTVVTTDLVSTSLLPVYSASARSLIAFPMDVANGLFARAWQGITAFFAPFFGFFRKKKKGAGVISGGTVFDGLTGAPLTGAYVVVYSPSGNLRTGFTDEKGIYEITPPPDTYVLKAQKHNFLFPSKLVTVSANSTFDRIYHPGEQIIIQKEGEKIPDVAIPLDPDQALSPVQKTTVQATHLMSFVVNKLNPILAVASLIVTGVAAYGDPTPFYKAMFATLVVIYGIQYGGRFIKARSFSLKKL